MARKQLGAAPGSASDAATQASVAESIIEAVPGILADDATVAAAAAEAAASAVEAADLVSGSDPRLPIAGDADVFRVRDRAGYTVLSVDGDGEAKFGATGVKPDGWYPGLRVYDNDDQLAFAIKPDGTVFIGQFSDDSAGASTTVSTVHVLIGAGQSNMAGAARPTDAEIDPPDPRIFQYGNTSEIETATVPLRLVYGTTNGLSVLTVIAREYLKRLPPGDVVLIIQGARGGSFVGSTTDTGSNGVWNAAYTGASVNLYGNLKTAITGALAAIPVKWPDATVKVAGLFWHQGEANSDWGTTDAYATQIADYKTRLDAMFAGIRTHLSDSDLPIVVGGMVPEYIAARTYTVAAAHIDTPKRVVRTGYADGVANGGGYYNVATDLVHYQREGVTELGRRMLDARDRALLNVTSSEPVPPRIVTATIVNGTLTANWSQPSCRYTAFVVEYSTNSGSTWSTITHSDVSTVAVKTSLTAPVMVRVSTTNETGTSAPSTAVYATLGG